MSSSVPTEGVVLIRRPLNELSWVESMGRHFVYGTSCRTEGFQVGASYGPVVWTRG